MLLIKEKLLTLSFVLLVVGKGPCSSFLCCYQEVSRVFQLCKTNRPTPSTCASRIDGTRTKTAWEAGVEEWGGEWRLLGSMIGVDFII